RGLARLLQYQDCGGRSSPDPPGGIILPDQKGDVALATECRLDHLRKWGFAAFQSDRRPRVESVEDALVDVVVAKNQPDNGQNNNGNAGNKKSAKGIPCTDPAPLQPLGEVPIDAP